METDRGKGCTLPLCAVQYNLYNLDDRGRIGIRKTDIHIINIPSVTAGLKAGYYQANTITTESDSVEADRKQRSQGLVKTFKRI